MKIIIRQALSQCISYAVRAELKEHFKTDGSQSSLKQRLLSAQGLATELGISLVILTNRITQVLLFFQQQKRVFFERNKAIEIIRQQTNST